MASKEPTPVPTPNEIADRGEAIYLRKYQQEFEKSLPEKFVAINVRNEEAIVADSGEDAVHAALQKDPDGLFFLIRVGHPGAFDAGWYMSCAS